MIRSRSRFDFVAGEPENRARLLDASESGEHVVYDGCRPKVPYSKKRPHSASLYFGSDRGDAKSGACSRSQAQHEVNLWRVLRESTSNILSR